MKRDWILDEKNVVSIYYLLTFHSKVGSYTLI